MCVKIYYSVLLTLCGIFTETWAFLPEFQQQHKKIIIRVPVITHTVYKVVNKGHKVFHHHHHDGHVAHVHKHEADAHHKHHHHGVGDHHHKHIGSADHKHLHAGKAEHGHAHKGHFSGNHHHKGHHGHDHKHTGMFSNAHAHSGSGTHTHGHRGDGAHGHGHPNHLGFGYAAAAADPNRLSYLGDDHLAATMGSHLPLYHQYRYADGPHRTPNAELAPPPPYGSPSYPADGDVRFFRSSASDGFVGLPYAAQQLYGRVKTAAAATPSKYAAATSYVGGGGGGEGVGGDEPKPPKVNVNLRSPMFNLFTPEETAEIENSLNSYDDFSSVGEGRESGVPSEFAGHEGVGEQGVYDEDELEKGSAFQPIKTFVPIPKRRSKQKFFAPISQYEVTENPHLI